METFKKIKQKLKHQGYCHHASGQYRTRSGLCLPCCTAFNKTCAPRAIESLERIIMDLCYENEKLQTKLATEKERLRPENNINVHNVNNTQNIYIQNNIIGVKASDILKLVRYAVTQKIPRHVMYDQFRCLVYSAPASENREYALSLINSRDPFDVLDSQMRVHDAFQEAVAEYSPADAAELTAFMDDDYKIVERACQDAGAVLVDEEDIVTKKRKV